MISYSQKLMSFGLVLSFFLFGCGKNSTNRKIEDEAMSSPQGGREVVGGEQFCYWPNKDRDLYVKIKSLYSNYKNLRKAFNESYPYQIFFNGAQYPSYSDLTPKRPLYIGKKIISEYYSEIVSSLNNFENRRFYRWLVKGELPLDIQEEFLDYGQENILRNIAQQIEGLQEISLHWKNDSCRLYNAFKRDRVELRNYAILEESECPRGRLLNVGGGYSRRECLQRLLKGWERYNESYNGLKAKAKKLILNLCKDSGNLGGQCLKGWDESLLNDDLLGNYERLKNNFKVKHYDFYFRSPPKGRQFNCSKDVMSSTVTLELPVYLGNLDGSSGERGLIRRFLEEEVSKKWSFKNKFKIKFVFKNYYKKYKFLRVFLKKGIVSHVKKSNPLDIYMAKDLLNQKNKLGTVLAHELGHIFNFPDCYIKYYDRDHKRLVYYQLKRNNLMCSISKNSFISENYFNQIIAKNCHF